MDSSQPVRPTLVSVLRELNPERVFKLVFALTLALMLLPVWMTEWPPLQDLGGHIELMDVMHRHDNAELAYGATYHLPGWFDANSLSLVAAWLLGPLIGTLATSKLLLSFYIVGLPLSLVAVARSFGRSPWLVLVGTPLVFNALLNVGFINYLIAMPLMFWMIPLAMKLAQSSNWRHALALGSCALLLFYAHVIAFLIGWSMAAFVLLIYGKRRAWLLGFFATLPALLILGLWTERMFLNPVATELGRTFGTAERGLATSHKPLLEKFTTFHTWGTNMFRDHLDEIALSAISVVWLIALTQARNQGATSPKSVLNKSQVRGKIGFYGLECITLICFIAYLLLPSGANEIAILAERVPIMIVVFLLLWPRTDMTTPLMKWSLVLATVGAMIYPLLVQERFARFEDRELSGLEDVVSHMEAGSKVAYVLERPTSDVTYMKPLWHIPKALHAIENGGITHDSFAIRPYTPIQYQTGQSPTRVRPRFERTASIYEYDYILLQTGTPPAYFFKRLGVSFVVNKDNWWLFKVQDPDKNSIVIRSPGRGGFQDMFNCPAGTALSGLSGERLSVVGNIRARCELTNRTPSETTDIGVRRHSKRRPTNSPAFGRTMRGGYRWESLCAKGEAIAGFRGRHDDFLRSLEVVCRSLTGESKHDYTLQALPHDEPFNFAVMCPAGTVATGYRGRSGLFIDQIGLKCEALRE